MHSIMDENYSEIADIAAGIGVNLAKARHLINFSGVWKNNVPALDKKSAGKVSLISSVKDNIYTITFKTFRQGGKTASWSGRQAPENYYSPTRNILKYSQTADKTNEDADAIKKKQFIAQAISKWEAATTICPDDFAYFKAKNVLATDLKLMSDHDGEYAVVPLYDAFNNVVGLQKLYENKKEYVWGTVRTGSYHQIGHQCNKRTWLVEGWATGATVHKLTGDNVIVCFDANNIIPNVRRLLEAGEDLKTVYLAADNDHAYSSPKEDKIKSVNTGLKLAVKLNKEYAIKARYPNFDQIIHKKAKASKTELSKEEKISEKKGLSDFNDLFCKYGEKEARNHLLQYKSSIVKAKESRLDYLGQCIKYGASSKKDLENYIGESLKSFIGPEMTAKNLSQFDCVKDRY